MKNVRVRFAPSPTGFFHIGSARTALFNWLYAKHFNGKFVLRIEDTDEERNTQEALDVLLDGLRWLGLSWDEGPEVGGEYGPYFQSQRADVYKNFIEALAKKDRLYEKDGALWFRVSGEPQIIDDLVRGKVTRTEEKDFVLVRSNSKPVFHLVNVVDDITMNITHVIRGEDHLSNTSKHLELFKALDAELPQYAHIPLILKTSGPGKMSKRDQGSLIEDYKRSNFLSEAVVNYLSLLGWSPKDDREILSLKEIVACFDITGVNKNNARFDEKKMSFINSQHLRTMNKEQFVAIGKEVLLKNDNIKAQDPEYVNNVLEISQEKIRGLDELLDFTSYFFKEDFPVEKQALDKILKKFDPIPPLQEFLTKINKLEDFLAENIEAKLKELCTENNRKTGEYINSIRLAVSGKSVGPSLYKMLEILGKTKTISRIQNFVNAL